MNTRKAKTTKSTVSRPGTSRLSVRAQSSDDSSSNSSWYVPSEHASWKSMVDEPNRDDDYLLEGPFRRAGLHRSFSFQGSSGLRANYLAHAKPQLYRHPEDNWEIESLSLSRLSFHQRKTIGCLWASKLSYYLALGMLPMVLPPIVEDKGLGTTATGTLFAIWGISGIIFWPLWKLALPKLGSKNLLTVGLFLAGVAFLLLGCLHFETNVTQFMILAYIFRATEGAGFAALEIATTTKILVEFPRHEAGAYGTMQTCLGVGATLGLFLSGFLYSVADIASALITCGSLLFLVGFLTICLLEKRPSLQSSFNHSWKRKKRFFKQSSVYAAILILFFGIVTASSTLPFLERHLRSTFGFTYMLEGIVLAVIPLSFAFGAGIWQWLTTHDYVCGLDCVNITGLLLLAGTFILLGPLKVLRIPTDLLWLKVICFIVMGGAMSMIYVASLNSLLERAQITKMNKLAAYSTIITTVTITSFLGIAVGTGIGGYLNETFGFQDATALMAMVLLAVSVIGILYALIKSVVRLVNYNRSIRQQEDAQRAQLTSRPGSRTARAPLVGASLAHKNQRALGRQQAQNIQADQRPLLGVPNGKRITYGTYL